MSREGSLERLVGEVLAARYRVGERLGAGAMGTVFRAEHVKIGRKLAIKFLSPRMVEHEKYRLRFDREAELAGRMHHRNVVGVLDVGITPEGLRYLVMEYAEGRTLTELIREGPLAAPRMTSLARQLCEGLDHAHAHGLVHRDFKPDNVIVERDAYGEETPRILDFGVAISVDDVPPGERKRLTTEGMVIGTPHYMAPEQASGRAIDHRVDLFALGVICYEMLTGVMPFEGGGVAVARAYLSRKIPPMQQRAPEVEVDPLLEAFTRALLARRRDERPPSAKAARALLELIARDRRAAAERLGVTLADQRRTLPVSPAPPPGRPPARAAGGTLPPAAGGTQPMAPQAAAWASLPTEEMPSDLRSPALASANAETARVAAADAGWPADADTGWPTDADAGWTGADADWASPEADTEQAAALAAETADVPAIGPVEPRAPRSRAAIAGSVAMARVEREERIERPERPERPEQRAPVTPPPMTSVLAAPSTPELARPEPAVPTYVMSRLRASARWRSVWIAAALVCVGLGAIVVVALRRDRGGEAPPVVAATTVSPPTAPPPPPTPPPSAAPAPPVPPTAPALEPPAPSAAPTPPTPTEATAAHPPAAPAVPAATTTPPAPAPVAPAPTTPAPPAAPTAAQNAAPAPPEAPSAEPTAAVVAELYGTIGRALKRLDQTRGQEATYDLWPRFRRIQILEALRTREARLAAHDELRYLEREIAQRSR